MQVMDEGCQCIIHRPGQSQEAINLAREAYERIPQKSIKRENL